MPVGPFGRALYDLIKQQRREDGSAWEAEDLGERVEVSAKVVRDWVKGVYPRADRLVRVARVFGVDAAALIEGKIVEAGGAGGQQPAANGAFRISGAHRALRVFEAELELAEARGEPLPREKARELYTLLRSAIGSSSAGGEAEERVGAVG